MDAVYLYFASAAIARSIAPPSFKVTRHLISQLPGLAVMRRVARDLSSTLFEIKQRVTESWTVGATEAAISGGSFPGLKRS